MKRFLGTLLAGSLLVILAEQSNWGPSAGLSKEWPTYGHDPGGMRFSPLTEITPANVDRLKVAWVYHMKPAGFAAPTGRRGDTAGAAVGDTPEGAPGGRGQGRGGSGFRPSENTPLVINGTMFM